MSERSVYLDTSSIIKRYVQEEGSEIADLVYSKAETGAHQIVMSLWNVGEAIGVLDNYHLRGLLGAETVLAVLSDFLAESEKMIRLGSMSILPLTVDTLIETYALVLKHHIYQADALQIASCKTTPSRLFLSADKKLLRAAKAEGVEAFDIETDQEQIRDRFH